MPKKLAEGDTVRLSDREAVAADTKSGLFYPHYRGLLGTVGKLYQDNTAMILVDTNSLPADIRTRHETGSQAMRQKWLDGLSEEARNRLSAAEKKFSLRYTILASVDDLSAAESARPTLPASGPGAEPARKSLAEIEAEEERHLEAVSKKARS